MAQFQEITYQANLHFGSFLSPNQGGQLIIQDDKFIFRPHSVNIGSLSDKEFAIRDICGYKKGILTRFTVYMNDNKDVNLIVWKKDDIIKELEARRAAIFQNNGEPVPPLKR
jgi:hypothetical protein